MIAEFKQHGTVSKKVIYANPYEKKKNLLTPHLLIAF